jgi:hypothetical protein
LSIRRTFSRISEKDGFQPSQKPPQTFTEAPQIFGDVLNGFSDKRRFSDVLNGFSDVLNGHSERLSDILNGFQP